MDSGIEDDVVGFGMSSLIVPGMELVVITCMVLNFSGLALVDLLLLSLMTLCTALRLV